jgi:DNA primase
MMQLGQAAGTAAALAEKSSADLPDVQITELRAALRAQRVELDWPRQEETIAYISSE